MKNSRLKRIALKNESLFKIAFNSNFIKNLIKNAGLPELTQKLNEAQQIDSILVNQYNPNINQIAGIDKFPIFQINEYIDKSDAEILKHIITSDEEIFNKLFYNNTTIGKTNVDENKIKNNLEIDVLSNNTFAIKITYNDDFVNDVVNNDNPQQGLEIPVTNELTQFMDAFINGSPISKELYDSVMTKVKENKNNIDCVYSGKGSFAIVVDDVNHDKKNNQEIISNAINVINTRGVKAFISNLAAKRNIDSSDGYYDRDLFEANITGINTNRLCYNYQLNQYAGVQHAIFVLGEQNATDLKFKETFNIRKK